MKSLERENKTLKLELKEYKQAEQPPTPSILNILVQVVQQDEQSGRKDDDVVVVEEVEKKKTKRSVAKRPQASGQT